MTLGQDHYRRCGAKTRKGTPCKNPCVRGRNRCRMHGGKTPRGWASPHYKHGFYSKDSIARILWDHIEKKHKKAIGDEALMAWIDQHPPPDVATFPNHKVAMNELRVWRMQAVWAAREARELARIDPSEAEDMLETYKWNG